MLRYTLLDRMLFIRNKICKYIRNTLSLYTISFYLYTISFYVKNCNWKGCRYTMVRKWTGLSEEMYTNLDHHVLAAWSTLRTDSATSLWSFLRGLLQTHKIPIQQWSHLLHDSTDQWCYISIIQLPVTDGSPVIAINSYYTYSLVC